MVVLYKFWVSTLLNVLNGCDVGVWMDVPGLWSNGYKCCCCCSPPDCDQTSERSWASGDSQFSVINKSRKTLYQEFLYKYMYMIFLMSKIGTLTKRSLNNLSKSQQIIYFFVTITTTVSKRHNIYCKETWFCMISL